MERSSKETKLNYFSPLGTMSWEVEDPYPIDCQFVSMKWKHGGSFDHINSRTDITHLFGYNESNRPDQSNMTVKEALAEWLELMRSGLRLGSPSVSDNSRLHD